MVNGAAPSERGRRSRALTRATSTIIENGFVR